MSIDVERLARVMCADREPLADPEADMFVDDECRMFAARIAAEYDRLTEDESPLGHGTPVREEATLPSGDERVS